MGGEVVGKPSVKSVKTWDLVYRSDLVELFVGTAVFDEDYWKVVPLAGGVTKYFYGETAWSDARRYASDFDFGAWAA